MFFKLRLYITFSNIRLYFYRGLYPLSKSPKNQPAKLDINV